MLRSVLSFVAIAAFAVSASAKEYSDTGGTFRLDMPDGWQSTLDPAVKVMLLSPRNADTGGNCNVIVEDSEETKSISQTDLDVAGTITFTEAFWRTALEGAELRNIKFDKIGSRTKNGRKVFHVRHTSDATVDASQFTITQLQDVHLVPGRTFILTCTALAEGMPSEETDFTAIMSSFEPLVEVPTAMMRTPAPPSLTLYDRPRFAGVSRVITQDTDDLTRFGWSQSAASFSVSGNASWQVCDGANFSGACRNLSGSNGAVPSFAVISARRVSVRPGDLTPIAASLSGGLKASLASTRGRAR